jgi:L-ascorbate metabolism protein UlaG (beta-lactamase superfamily)
MKMLKEIHWLGHASFRIELGGLVVYIDPWKLKNPLPADLVLVTHDHHDHLSEADISKISKAGTVILCAAKAAGSLHGEVRAVKPGLSLQIGDARVQTVPAYNIGKAFHPQKAEYVGYILAIAGMSIYHAGDTDLIPEMAEITCDVALLPIGGTYTMDAVAAAKALSVIKTQVAVPMHWGDLVGSRKDAELFVKLAPTGVQVTLLDPE